MTYKVGPKGQVVLPKAMRERLGIHPGDEVLFAEGEGEITVRKAESKEAILDRLVGSLRDSEIDPLAELEAEHRRELEQDAREMRARGHR